MAIEAYAHGAGRLYIAHSDRRLSIGLLVLDPKKEFAKHNRPVLEQLTQIRGASLMRLLEKGRVVKEVTLKEGNSMEISAGQFHVHSNPFDETSVTMWKYEGDVTEVIKGLRDSMQRV